MELIVNEGLPHIGEYIYGFLSGPDLCICRLVCKSWNEFLIQRHKLWIQISENIINSIQFTSSQQWQLIQKASNEPEKARNVCLMLLWYKRKCDLGFPSESSPYVASFKHPESLKFMLSISPIKNPIDNFGAGILHLAAVYDRLEAIKIISNELEDKNPPASKLSYYTPLHFATVQNNIECMKYLLENASDKNPKALNDKTPLHIATEFGHIEGLKLLLNYCEEKNPRMNEGGRSETPFHIACENGSVQIVEYLLNYIEDLNEITSDGMTGLHLAVIGNHIDVIELFEDYAEKIDFNIKNHDGKTAYECAYELDREEICDLIADLEIG